MCLLAREKCNTTFNYRKLISGFTEIHHIFFRIKIWDKGVHWPKHHRDDIMYIIPISFLREWARKLFTRHQYTLLHVRALYMYSPLSLLMYWTL